MRIVVVILGLFREGIMRREVSLRTCRILKNVKKRGSQAQGRASQTLTTRLFTVAQTARLFSLLCTTRDGNNGVDQS